MNIRGSKREREREMYSTYHIFYSVCIVDYYYFFSFESNDNVVLVFVPQIICSSIHAIDGLFIGCVDGHIPNQRRISFIYVILL